jgi:hypothetical protein
MEERERERERNRERERERERERREGGVGDGGSRVGEKGRGRRKVAVWKVFLEQI